MKKGTKHSEEARKKMSEAQKKRPPREPHFPTEDSRKKMSIAQTGRKHSEETKKKMSGSAKGVPKSEEHKKHMSEANKGKKASAETKVKMSIAHTNPSEEIRKKISESLKGNTNAVGLVHSEEFKKKISNRHKNNTYRLGIPHTAESKKKIGLAQLGNKHNIGYKHTKEAKKNMGDSKKGQNNGRWLGGKSFEPYGLEFNEEVKSFVRQRDGHICQECGINQENLQYKLSAHHIDYNKLNSVPENLISLCQSCHSKTGANRSYWTEYFNLKMANEMFVETKFILEGVKA